MKSAFVLALAGLAMASPAPQSSALAAAPQNCAKSYDGAFEITIVTPSGLNNDKRALQERQSTCGQTGILTLTLQNGNLMDNDGRTGYIASNNSQFQFDKPVQAGGIYAGEFTACKNGSIALGPTTTFYQCQSGGFYNLYYDNIAAQCDPVNIDIIPCSNSSSSSTSAASAAPKTSVAAATGSSSAKPVSVTSDGQPQATAMATSAMIPVSVFSDGQPQATVKATSVAAVSEFTDGQPQATAKATAASNMTANATAKPTIVTAGGAALTAPAFLAGAFALFALL